MKIKEDLVKIKESKEYNKFTGSIKLISCFLDGIDKSGWDYNFYNEQNMETLTFCIENNEVIFKGNDKIVNSAIPPKTLLLEELQSEQEDIFNIMKKELLKECGLNEALKFYAIIEQNEEIMWGFLILLRNLNVIHMKIKDNGNDVIENKSIQIIKKKI